MTTAGKILLFLNPLFLFSAASFIVKLSVLANLALAASETVIFLVRLLQRKPAQPSGFLAALTWMGPAVSALGIAYVAYVYFGVIEPEMRGEPLQWLVSAGDTLVAMEAGALTALVGIVGSRLLRRNA
jgi:hypothetical protein